MRVALASDVHLEFGDLILKNEDNADVLLLAGDICVAKELQYSDSKYYQRFHDFFSRCAFQFKDVIYIAGNHEHYNGDYADTYDIMKYQLAKHKNIRVLDKDFYTIGDTTFFGGTLWTDMNGEDKPTMSYVQDRMNDFRCIINSNKMVQYKDMDNNRMSRPSKFSPADAVVDHKAFLKSLDDLIVMDRTLVNDHKYVVVGHHCPSKISTKPQYEKDVLMNGGYSSVLDGFIMDHPEIKLWVHGHTHHNFDYNISGTRILCNPRGYVNYEYQSDEWKLITVEV